MYTQFTDTSDQKTEQPATEAEMEALDIIEAGQDVPDEIVERLDGDEQLRRYVRSGLELREDVRNTAKGIDVEARLALFHARHDGHDAVTLPWWHRWHRVAVAAAVVAAVVTGAALLLMHHNLFKRGTSAQSELIFAAAGPQAGISLTSNQGANVELNPDSPQKTAISLDDFQQALEQLVEGSDVTLTIPYGKSADLTLPDGSVASLYPGSRLAFPSRFSGRNRVVRLYGQAYFKVAHDEAHPFVVLTDRLRTTVLGTEFNIDAETDRVVLVKGSVRVAAGADSICLAPAQQATLVAGRLQVAATDITPYEYWRDGYLYFDNVSMHDIMLAIGRNYNLNVEFADTSLWNSRMRFITDRNANIDETLRRMNEMQKGMVSRKGETIRVASHTP